MITLKLIEDGGILHWPVFIETPCGLEGVCLYRILPDGTCRTVPWPLPTRPAKAAAQAEQDLRAAVAAAVAGGWVPNTAAIRLPNGALVE